MPQEVLWKTCCGLGHAGAKQLTESVPKERLDCLIASQRGLLEFTGKMAQHMKLGLPQALTLPWVHGALLLKLTLFQPKSELLRRSVPGGLKSHGNGYHGKMRARISDHFCVQRNSVPLLHIVKSSECEITRDATVTRSQQKSCRSHTRDWCLGKHGKSRYLGTTTKSGLQIRMRNSF